MKRMFNREFVIYPQQGSFVIFNYPSLKGKNNRGNVVMYVKILVPTESSWKRVEELLWRNKYPVEMARNQETGEIRFVFSAGESLS